MGHLTPRAAEIDAMLDVLEPDVSQLDPWEYDDARHTASDLLKAAYQILRRRDWWIVGHQPGATWDAGAMSVAYGIETSEFAARRMALTMGYGCYALKRVYGATAFEADVAAQDANALDKFGDEPCVNCHHRRVHHGATRTIRNRIVNDVRPARAPCSSRCPCREFI